jgi:hypothetical protein
MDVVGVEDVLVVGLTLRGGYRGLTVRGGSSFESNGVVIEEAVRTGVFIAGAETTATLSDTVVRGVQLDQEAYGWGVVVQDATVVLNQVDVTDTHAVGVLVEFGNATFNGGTVRGVAADEQGLFGRGVQLQNLAQGALADLSVETTADAGVFAHRTVALDVSNIWVVDTGGGLTAEGTPTGDGLVVTQANGNNDPADFQVTVTDSIFECSDRAGVVLDGVTATLNGVTTPDSGLEEGGIGVWAQNGAQVTGENNLAGEPLGLNLVTLSD